MERLTHRYTDGKAWANIYNVCACGENECKGPIIDRLAAYEDTGMEPEEIYGLCEMDKRSRMAKMLRWEKAERDGRLVVLPKISEADRKLFADNLHDVFTEWANYDPSVGIFGMSEGERALANAIMKALAPDEAEAALAEKGAENA